MSLPAAIQPITVTASYLTADGEPQTGLVTFTPSVIATVAGGILTATPVRIQLDETGSLSVVLAATDDPQWSAPGWTYTVTENFTRSQVRRYSVELPYDTLGATIDLATIVPVADPAAVSPYVLEADLFDADGLINSELLPGGSGESVAWTSITGKPATFPPSAHTHVQADVQGLSASLAALTPLTTFDALEDQVEALDGRVGALEEGSGGGGGGATIVAATSRRTSGSLTGTSSAGAWEILPNFTVAVAAVAGDQVECKINALLDHNSSRSDFYDIAIVAGGSIVRAASTGTATPATQGDPGAYPDVQFMTYAGSFLVTAASGDLAGGNITFALIHKGPGNGKVFADTDYPLRGRVINFGSAS